MANQNQEPTPEQIAAYIARVEEIQKADMAQWKKEESYIKAKKAHLTLMVELSELDLRYKVARMRIAQMMAPQQPDEDTEEQDGPEPQMPEVPTNKVASEPPVEEQEETSNGLSENQIRKLKKS